MERLIKWRPWFFGSSMPQVFVYGNSPNGLNINDWIAVHCILETIQKAVIDHTADVGIALDGDAGRVVMVDENAQLVDGDTILAICAKDMQKQGLLPQ